MKAPYDKVVILCENHIQAQHYSFLAEEITKLLGCKKIRFQVDNEYSRQMGLLKLLRPQ